MISYCVTTVPERRHTTLPQTLSSLADAGFRFPILFVDGDPSDAEYGDLELPVAFRELEGYKIGAFGNFVLACWELYIRSPQSDFYFMFQDDVQLAFSLDWFLGLEIAERTDCWWNFYTTRETFVVRGNKGEAVRTLASPVGWSESAQRGQGALAMAFPNRVLRKILNATRLTMNCLHPTKGNRDVDGAISDAMRAEKIVELCHTPSLAYHIGEESAIGHGRRPQADPWWGVNWQDKLTSRSGDDAGIRDQLPESGAVSPRDAEVAV